MPLDVGKCLEVFKKYGRTPRDVQVTALEMIADAWDNYKVISCLGPVGIGKSWIFFAIQEVMGGSIVTSQNPLVDQYRDSFPSINILKGKKRYACHVQATCADFFAETSPGEQRYCTDCPYQTSIDRAQQGHATVFNIMSYLTAVKRGDIPVPEILMLDEAHTAGNFLREISSSSFRQKDCGFTEDDLRDFASIKMYVKRAYAQLNKLVADKRAAGEFDGLKDDQAMLEKLYFIKDSMEKGFNDFIFYAEDKAYNGKKETVLTMKAMLPPDALTAPFRQSDKLLLMSGTLQPHHISEFVGTSSYKFLEFPNPIPPEKRKIVVSMASNAINADTPPEVFVAKIKEIMKKHPNERGIIHATYGLAEKLKDFFDENDVIFHRKHDKTDALQRFIKGDGKYLLASGMAEGIDLVGDIARVNIICKLQFPYLGDEYVTRRMDIARYRDGAIWYQAEALTHLIQAAGRTTRGPEDSSVTYVLDPSIYRVIEKIKSLTKWKPELTKQYLTQGFLDAFRG